jgi:hypothetical protein
VQTIGSSTSNKYSGGLEKFLLSLRPVAKLGEVLLWIMASPPASQIWRKGKKKTRGGDGKTINTICWKWLTLIEAQIGGVGGDALRPKPWTDEFKMYHAESFAEWV